MALDSEQAKTIKAQLLKQIDSFPEDKQDSVKQYIESMTNEQLEEFIVKNKLIKTEENSTDTKKPGSDCVYCLLANKSMKSISVYEDESYLGAMEIKPLSDGHIVLIPKEHIKDTKSLPAKAFSLADKIAKKIVKKLGAADFQISSSDDLKHAVINIIPVYNGKELNTKRTQADLKKLQEIATKIGEIKKTEKKVREKKKVEKKSEEAPKKSLPIYPRRIP